MAEIRQLITLERRNMPDGADIINYRVPIEADADLFRYATYGLDGIIKGFGDEFGYTAIGQNFTVKHGKAAINGRTAIVPTGGKTFAAGTSATNTYWLVYIEINMSRPSDETAELIAVSRTDAYPVIQLGEDLTLNPFGIARRELYRFSAASGNISDIQKMMNIIEYEIVRFDNFKSEVDTKINTGLASLRETKVLDNYSYTIAAESSTYFSVPLIEGTSLNLGDVVRIEVRAGTIDYASYYFGGIVKLMYVEAASSVNYSAISFSSLPAGGNAGMITHSLGIKANPINTNINFNFWAAFSQSATGTITHPGQTYRVSLYKVRTV